MRLNTCLTSNQSALLAWEHQAPVCSPPPLSLLPLPSGWEQALLPTPPGPCSNGGGGGGGCGGEVRTERTGPTCHAFLSAGCWLASQPDPSVVCGPAWDCERAKQCPWFRADCCPVLSSKGHPFPLVPPPAPSPQPGADSPGERGLLSPLATGGAWRKGHAVSCSVGFLGHLPSGLHGLCHLARAQLLSQESSFRRRNWMYRGQRALAGFFI